jgi:hypothetical protein
VVVRLRAAIDEVASRDPVLAGLVARVGNVRHRARDPDGPFARSSGRSSSSSSPAEPRRRSTAASGPPSATNLTPESLSAVSDAALRSAGLSANKLASLRDLSAKVLDGTVVLTPSSCPAGWPAAVISRRSAFSAAT